MLSIEEIKKACEFAGGFEIVTYEGDDCWSLNGIRLSKLKNIIGKMVNYSLFLQRVIEGINYKLDIDYSIEQSFGNTINVIHAETETIKTFSNTIRFDDQAKEQAIKYILEKLC